MVREEYIKGTTRVTQTSRAVTEIRQKRYGHMTGREAEDMVRRGRNARYEEVRREDNQRPDGKTYAEETRKR